jgi:hypothetical protein
MRPRRRFALIVVALTLTAVAPPARAQTPTLLRVQVRDEAGTPVGRAEVTVVRGLREVVASGATDEAGTTILDATLAGGEHHDVVRKRGFERVERFFTVGLRDTIAVDLTAPHAATVADPEAWQRYLVDAETIAASTPPVADAPEILTRLRPAMLLGQAGDDACRPVRDVRVNDRPVRAAASDAAAAERYEGHEARRVVKVVPPNESPAIPPHVRAVLQSIRPEHVAEMRNAGCVHDGAAPAGSAGVLSVVLKPGVAYEPGVGSHAADADDRSAPDRPLAPYRSRLLVVYDAVNGEPVAGVEVTHVASGAKGVTNLAGTVALEFLPEGESSVRVARTGYQPIELPVTISRADDRPITLLLRRAK